MPQNDIKLMHNFTTHLSRHALSHRGYEAGVCLSVCVPVCVCATCVLSAFFGCQETNVKACNERGGSSSELEAWHKPM